ncbi:TetR/AcrR family transcriptional regulator [Phenylobacterium sp.]|uniref:TetR/AcrR family transcriptional regulator n=1 Tax=Phenylobacterium sp. TaxID=1871053 RepID=UPI00394E5F4C
MEPKTSYHHGDLARAAVDAAFGLVRAGGPEAVSMREVAGKVGVAHRALYRPFGDREGLLNAVAARGYDLLADRLAAAVEADDPRRAFVAAYARFALEEPGLYALVMGRDRRQIAAAPALKAASDRVIQLSLRGLAPGLRGAEARDAVIAVWSLLHGALALYRSGLIRAADADQLADYLVRLTEGRPFSAGT